MRSCVLGIALAGCGRLGFDAVPAPGDGVTDIVVDPDGSAPMGCNAITRFADDFADNVDAFDQWTRSYYEDMITSYAETGGEVVLTLASMTGSHYAGYKTTRSYDLRGHRVSIEVTQLAGPGATTGLGVEYNSGTYLHVSVRRDATTGNPTLTADQRVGGVFKQLASMPYDAAQRFWAIEESSGQVSFETSSDGVVFTPFHQASAPFDLSQVASSMFAGTDGLVPAPGAAHFASYNGGVAQFEMACPVASLVDLFEDGVAGHDWERSYNNATCCTQTESGGVLQLATNGMPGYTARRSSSGYNFKEAALTVEVPSGPTAGTFYGDFGLELDTKNSLSLQIDSNQFHARTIVAGSPTQLNLTRTGQTWVRIRDTAGTIYYEVSADKVNWDPITQLAEPFAVDDVTVSLEAGIANNPSMPASIRFDNLDVP